MGKDCGKGKSPARRGEGRFSANRPRSNHFPLGSVTKILRVPSGSLLVLPALLLLARCDGGCGACSGNSAAPFLRTMGAHRMALRGGGNADVSPGWEEIERRDVSVAEDGYSAVGGEAEMESVIRRPGQGTGGDSWKMRWDDDDGGGGGGGGGGVRGVGSHGTVTSRGNVPGRDIGQDRWRELHKAAWRAEDKEDGAMGRQGDGTKKGEEVDGEGDSTSSATLRERWRRMEDPSTSTEQEHEEEEVDGVIEGKGLDSDSERNNDEEDEEMHVDPNMVAAEKVEKQILEVTGHKEVWEYSSEDIVDVDQVEDTFEAAVEAHDSDRYAADRLYKRVLRVQPNHLGALCNFGEWIAMIMCSFVAPPTDKSTYSLMPLAILHGA
jgi:hypothetical protein